MFSWFTKRKAPQRANSQQSSQANEPVSDSSQERRHREDVPYALPKDLEEGQRLHLQHYIFRYMLHGNYAAPLPETVSSILDVGSGTGIWGQEMAQRFPSARVFGMDLEPPQSVSLSASITQTPANYHFVQGDILQGLPFADRTFDYTHQRMLTMAIPSQKWPAVIKDLVRVTRPGGWVELIEIGGTDITPPGPASAKLGTWLSAGLAARGLSMDTALYLGDMLTRAGLQSVNTRVLDIPLGSWDRHLGTLLEKDTIAVFDALKPIVCQKERITPEQFDEYIQQAKQEWNHAKAVGRFHLAYGQV